MHQIRVHAERRGHPLAGDPQYGGGFPELQPTPPCERLLLHAHSLTIAHPARDDGALLRLTAPPPPLFLDEAERLGLRGVRERLEQLTPSGAHCHWHWLDPD